MFIDLECIHKTYCSPSQLGVALILYKLLKVSQRNYIFKCVKQLVDIFNPLDIAVPSSIIQITKIKGVK